MKKLISIALLVVFSTAAFSQINDVKLDSNLTINKIYVGILNTTAFNTEAATVTNNFSFRVGTMATWQTTKWMKVKAFATLDYSDGTATPINSFSVKFHNKKEGFGVELGYMATPATESRPLPPSAAGHFETFTEANIPGSALGIKTGVKIGKTTTLSAGVCARNKEAEYHLRFGSKVVDLSVFANPTSQEFGGVSVIKAGPVYNTTVFKNKVAENFFANFTNVELNKKKDICWYLDFGYQIDTKEVKRLETGLFKTFSSKWVNGLVCLGYRHENKSVCGYLFVHL